MRWVCKYATCLEERSFRTVMYAGMLREDLFLEPYDDGSVTKIEGQVLQSKHYAAKKCLSPRFVARGVPSLSFNPSRFTFHVLSSARHPFTLRGGVHRRFTTAD